MFYFREGRWVDIFYFIHFSLFKQCYTNDRCLSNCLTWILIGIILCPRTWVHIIFCLVPKYKNNLQSVTHIPASLKVQSIKRAEMDFKIMDQTDNICSSVNSMGHLQVPVWYSILATDLWNQYCFSLSSERDTDSLWITPENSAYYCISLWTLTQCLQRQRFPASVTLPWEWVAKF